MAMAAMAPAERPGRFLASLVEPARTGFGLADGTTIAGKTVLPKRGPGKGTPVFCEVLVVVAGGDDDDKVPVRFITAGNVGVGREMNGDGPWEKVGFSMEPCTAVVIGGPCPLDTGETGGKESGSVPCS